jgi:hypothetical protein
MSSNPFSLNPRLAIQPEGRLADILSVLLEASNPNKLIAGEPDVETRRAAVQAVVELAERLPMKASEMNLCFEILLRSCDDYKTDKRGDTGSWCRIAAVQGMEKMLYTCFRKSDFTGATRMTSFGPGNVNTFSDNKSSTSTLATSSSDINTNPTPLSQELDVSSPTQIFESILAPQGLTVTYPPGSLGRSFAYSAYQVLYF